MGLPEIFWWQIGITMPVCASTGANARGGGFGCPSVPRLFARVWKPSIQALRPQIFRARAAPDWARPLQKIPPGAVAALGMYGVR